MKKPDFTALKRTVFNMSTSVIALILSFIVGGFLVTMIGVSPFEVYKQLLMGGVGDSLALVGTLNRMAPILLAGISLTIGNASGIFNMGFDGQFLCGCMAAVTVGLLVPMPAALHIPVAMLAGVAGGMLWSVLPITLLLKRNINVVFSCIMLNYVANYMVDYLIQILPAYESTSNATPKIMETAILPYIISNPVKISVSVLVSILMVVFCSIYMFRTRAGYEMRAVGQNRFAARSAGINVNNRMFSAMLLSAACAGLSGSLEVMGMTYRLTQNYAPGYMGMGIAVAMLGKQNPVAILVAAFLFSAMKNGTTLMQMNTGVSQQFVMALQGLIIIFICSENFIRFLANKLRIKRRAAADA